MGLAKNKPNSNAYFPCFVGLEYECYNPQNAEKRRFIGMEFPTQNIPLRVSCKQCSNFRGHHDQSIVNGQLQRAFVVTSPSPIAITAKPVIMSLASQDAVFEFDTCV